MYKIKQLLEDFVVRELSSIELGSGQYSYFFLKKTNYATLDALQILANKFKIPLKNFGFAGNKDKRALTEQKISIFKGKKDFEQTRFNNIELRFLGNGKKPISLGELEGNEFTITIRNLTDDGIKKIRSIQDKKLKIPNLYGPQRFSKNNQFIGKAIIKREFKKATELILENNGKTEGKIGLYIMNNKNDYIGAINLIPFKTRKLFVHSYQSFLFNKVVEEYLKNNSKIKNIKIPIIGFNFEINSIKNQTIKKITEKILEEEKIKPRDFIINQMPELSSEGSLRDLFFEFKDLKILEINDDELNQNTKRIKINFTLPKSCYATVLLEYVLQ